VTIQPKYRSVFLFDLAPSIAAMPVSVEQAVSSEIQLCRTGDFYRADMGHFKVRQSTLDKMMANANERGVDIPINYHHLGNNAQAPIESRNAAGWVSPKSLRIAGYKGGLALYGMATWTAEAVALLKGQKLRYISPEIEWSAVRMAASDAGPAGAPIGPMLTGAALVNDPFFTLNPVTLSRRAPARATNFGASKRYNMVSETAKAAILKLLKAAGVEATALDGLMAQIIVALMTEEAPMAAPEVIEEPVMEAATPATPAAEGAAQQSLAASRESNAALARRVQELEARDRARETEQAEQLFARYQREGRYRVYALAGSDPDGTKKARALLSKGVAFFREVFDAIPALVGSAAPQAPQGLPRAGQANATAMSGEDQGRALHDRTMAEIKAKGLKMTDYGRISAQFARG
jgi:phage I-like protein